ncbi:MAG: hypothetical protein WDN06_10375 [Asticcacaulis sp.]
MAAWTYRPPPRRSTSRRPWSVAGHVDPEQALVAAASSCHMLWFLYFAATGGFIVDSYADAAEGISAKNAAGLRLDAAHHASSRRRLFGWQDPLAGRRRNPASQSTSGLPYRQFATHRDRHRRTV